jgi:hypothetical protein
MITSNLEYFNFIKEGKIIALIDSTFIINVIECKNSDEIISVNSALVNRAKPAMVPKLRAATGIKKPKNLASET